MSKHQIIRNRSGLLTLATALLGGLAVPASAQNPAFPRVAPEQGFTIATNVHTPVVLKTEPHAACDLHPSGATDQAHKLKVYANAEGYVKVHVTAKEENQDVHLQLDCTTAASVTIHPLHLRAGSSPTDDMPAPETSIPTPKDAKVVPVLTEESAKQLSDDDVINLGYPPRPDAESAPDQYVHWLDMVSHPLTVLWPRSVSRPEKLHQPQSVVAAASSSTSANWSGYLVQGGLRSFMGVTGEWNVPPILAAEPNNSTYSTFWVGLDGFGLNDLVQAGTEQDVIPVLGFLIANYYAWTEVVPLQAEQQADLPINPGDQVWVNVWIGYDTSPTHFAGGHTAYFSILNATQHQAYYFTSTSFEQLPSNALFQGSQAEWIMERTCISSCLGSGTPVFGDLSDYGAAFMTLAQAQKATGSWIDASASTVQINMKEKNTPWPDNDLLSTAVLLPKTTIAFQFVNFH